MTFGPIDFVVVFVCVFLFMLVVAFALLRAKRDVVAWATLVAASLPPTLYFLVRTGCDLPTTATTVAAMAGLWAYYLELLTPRRVAALFLSAIRGRRSGPPPAPLDSPKGR